MEILGAVVRAAPVLLARLAIEHTRTVEGAQRIWRVEKDGLCRPEVLRAAEKRIAELGGTQPDSTAPLIEVRGQAVETESINYQPKPQIVVPRIIEAVGRGKRHPGW